MKMSNTILNFNENIEIECEKPKMNTFKVELKCVCLRMNNPSFNKNVTIPSRAELHPTTQTMKSPTVQIHRRSESGPQDMWAFADEKPSMLLN